MKTRYLKTSALGLCLAASVLAQSHNNDPLAVYLNHEFMSPVPASADYFRPGALVAMSNARDAAPNYAGVQADAEALRLQQAHKMIPNLNLHDSTQFNIAATLLGVAPSVAFEQSHTLQADEMQLYGWRLADGESEKLRAANSATSIKAHEMATRLYTGLSVFNHRHVSVYLIGEVYTTVDANITTGGATSVGVSVGQDAGTCPAGNGGAITTTNTQAGSQPANTNTNNLSPKADQNIKVNELPTKKADIVNTAATALPYKGKALYCKKPGGGVWFSSQSPVPIAMSVWEISWNVSDGKMNFTPKNVIW